MGGFMSRFKNWRTSAAATMAIPEILRELANFMDADPSTPVNWTMLLIAVSVLCGLGTAADAKQVSKAASKAEVATVAATEAHKVAVGASQIAQEASVIATAATVSADASAVSATVSAQAATESADAATTAVENQTSGR